MMYHGKLYGKLFNKYFDTSHTTDEWDEMQTQISELKAKSEKTKIETLEWVLQQADELQNKIWDLREVIHTEIEKINDNGPES